MNVFDVVYSDDPFSICCVIVIFYAVASKMARGDARLWGWRAAGVAYAAFVVYACARVGPTCASDLAHIAFRGLFAAGLTVSIAWFAITITVHLSGVLCRIERSMAKRPAPQPELPHVDRERELRDREQRENQRAAKVAACEELRLECELLYGRHAEKLQGVLPRERFKALLDSYLSGQRDPDRVRKRTRMIRRMLTDQLSAAETSERAAFESLQELAEHFATLRREIQELPYDEDARESILKVVNRQEDETIEAFLKKDAL